ncbi:peptidase S8/S53 domain-containing protein [Spinellus fusiger]|nr:peptidase S8/S53 domain-containing protein [Spinellus fusiger]
MLICIISLLLCLSVLTLAQDTIHSTTNAVFERNPTHIIKLRPGHHNNTDDAYTFLMQHHRLFKHSQTNLHNHSIEARSLATKLDASAIVKRVILKGNLSFIIGEFSQPFVNYLQELEEVEYTEANQIYRTKINADPFIKEALPKQKFGRKLNKKRDTTSSKITVPVPSWGLSRIYQHKADNLTHATINFDGGAGVHVYILDSGINAAHKEFGGRAVMEASFVEGDTPQDSYGHGTHVAGIVGGRTYGVAKNVRLHGIKILDRHGNGNTAALLQAIDYILASSKPGKTLINLSLSGPRSIVIDQVLQSLVLEHNIPVFTSAGNMGDDACKYSPSANPHVFSVGSSSEQDAVSYFSAYGDCVNMYAPGHNIISSWLGQGSRTLNGTSMAAPHVTGIAALLMAKNSYKTAQELYDNLSSIATKDILIMNPVVAKKSHNLLAYAPTF